ncbi:MAG: cell division protein FtsA [Nitrospirae bacterium]|nr:cell division protein FtsA [Nitrospirota bacterium]
MAKREHIVVGLDVGTTKICAIVGEVSGGALPGERPHVRIIGIGTHPSRGLRKGVVVNVESTIESIKKAVEEAELMAGVEINSVYTGIAGSHIKGFNSRGVIAIKNREVTAADVQRVVEAAKAVAIPMDREILHVLPRGFAVDDQEGIKDPIGMFGTRLEVEVHIITGAVTSAQNIVRSINRAGLEVVDLILQPLASSEAVLTPEERELGVAMIDIGGGTTDLATIVDNSVWHTAVLGIGGNHVTNDIAVGLRTPAYEAEKIKIRYGCASTSMVRDNETIEVPSMGGRPARVLSRQLLSEIIEPRAEEIFSLVAQDLRKMGYDERVAAGVVITGGTSILDGMVELAERVMDLPVRRGAPTDVGGLVDIVNSPMYATGVGLILYGAKSREPLRSQRSANGMMQRVVRRMKDWAQEFF